MREVRSQDPRERSVRCVICGGTKDIHHLNANGQQLLIEYLELKLGDSAVVCVCKLCIATKELTGEWQMICAVCKKGFAKPPAPCDKCGACVCKDCFVAELPPGIWEIRHNVPDHHPHVKGTRIRICKNCVAERNLTDVPNIEFDMTAIFDPVPYDGTRLTMPRSGKMACSNGQVLDVKEGDVLKYDGSQWRVNA